LLEWERRHSRFSGSNAERFQDQRNTQGKANCSRKNGRVEKKKPDPLGNMATEFYELGVGSFAGMSGRGPSGEQNRMIGTFIRPQNPV